VQQLKFAVKWTLAQVLYRTGVLHAWTRLVHRRKVIVLTYHRVLPEEVLEETWSHPGIIVTRKTFDRHLRMLTRLFNVMSPSDFVTHMETGTPFRGPACLVTFDDGWRDTFTEAGPLLKQYGVPAVVFLPVDFIGTDGMFWQEQLGRSMYEAWERCRQDGAFRARLEAVLPASLAAALSADASHVRELIKSRVNELKSQPSIDPRALGRALRAELGADRQASIDAFMDWNDVRAMAAAGTTFGGHSTTHRIMTTLSQDEILHEVQTCRDAIERELGDRALTFSYPNGDFNDHASRTVRDAGFRVSFSTRPGVVSAEDDRFAIRRVNVHEDATRSLPLFLAKIAGVF
jgi:peptidoglycan/xylan/chitin deacetylase (PgdA/CDA1 family)